MGKDDVGGMKTHEQFQKQIEQGAENPYLSIPKPDEVKHMKDRYGHADKQKACWQVKWDLIHCVTDSDCVKVEGNRARDCLRRRDVSTIYKRFRVVLLVRMLDKKCSMNFTNVRHYS